MPKNVPKFFSNFLGLDLRSTDLNRDDNYATVMDDCQIRKSGALEKRKGSQARLVTEGGHGTYTYNNIDQTTGVTTQELITASDRLWRRTSATFTITYAGSGSATVAVQGDSTNSAVFMNITEDGSSVLSTNVGKGFDETTPVDLAALKIIVDAVTDFSSAITGTTSIPAAFLKFTSDKDGPLSSSNTTASFTAYEWTGVNRTVSSGPFAGSETNKNSTDFENISAVDLNGVLYLGNGYDENQKYDGQTLYRSGLPKPVRPTLSNTASGGGTAEVTDVTTRAEAGVAQIQDITCIADTRANMIKTIEYDQQDVHTGIDYNTADNHHWFFLHTPTEVVMIWFYVTDGAPVNQDKPWNYWTEDRDIQVDILSADDREAIATATQVAIDADSDFTAAIGGSPHIVTMTTVADGAIEEPWKWWDSMFLTNPAISIDQEGDEGLHQKYFTLKDEDGSVAFWMDLTGTGIEPSHGADRAVEITTISAQDSANTVAGLIGTAVNADSKFSTSVVTDTVTATNSSLTDVGQDVSDGTSGFTVAVTTEGEGSLHETYFVLYEGVNEAGDGVAFWYDVGGGGVEPSHGENRAVEITTVSASDSANTVASVTSTAVNADSAFSTSVSTNVVTVTAAASGNYPDGSAGTAGFTVAVTTQGLDPGLGGGTWAYRLVFKQKDQAGNIYTGVPNDLDTSDADPSITLGVSTDNVQMLITGIQAESGFNTDCAIVDGNQTAATTITVDSGHTHRVGNTAYFFDRTSGVGDYVEREITGIAATTITIDGDAVDVNADDIISNNLRVQINRSVDGGTVPFLVAEVPNDSINGTFVYVDGILDACLGAEFLEPLQPHSLPPKCRYLAGWKRQLIMSGDPENVNTLYVSYVAEDGNTSEYFPAISTLQVETQFGDKITGLCPNNEVFAVLKEKSIHVVSGDPQTGNIRVDSSTSGEHGCSSHNSIAEVNGACIFLDQDGVYAVSGGQTPVEVSLPIRSIFTDPSGFVLGEFAFKRAVGFNDRINDRYILYLPIETTDSSGNRYAIAGSKILVWDYFRNAWFEWTGLNMAGGMTKVDDDIYFSERRFSSTTTDVDHVMYQFNNSESDADYMDHVTAISSVYRSNWFDMGEPSFFKKWTRLKMFNTDAVTPDGFSLTVETEKNYVPKIPSTTDPTVLSTNASVSFNITTDRQYQRKIRLRPSKSRSMRFGFLNSQDNINWSLSGFEIETALIQRPSDMKE